MNFNISKLVYLVIHPHQRNFGSHVTVRMSARPSVIVRSLKVRIVTELTKAPNFAQR